MKAFLAISLTTLSVLAARAEAESADPATPELEVSATAEVQAEKPAQATLQAQPTLEAEVVEPVAPDPFTIETQRGRFRGLMVQWVKADNPLQLINPFAPAHYGSGEANLVEDPIERRPRGLALLRFEFK